jgi:hypothetical protein
MCLYFCLGCITLITNPHMYAHIRYIYHNTEKNRYFLTASEVMEDKDTAFVKGVLNRCLVERELALSVVCGTACLSLRNHCIDNIKFALVVLCMCVCIQ